MLLKELPEWWWKRPGLGKLSDICERSDEIEPDEVKPDEVKLDENELDENELIPIELVNSEQGASGSGEASWVKPGAEQSGCMKSGLVYSLGVRDWEEEPGRMRESQAIQSQLKQAWVKISTKINKKREFTRVSRKLKKFIPTLKFLLFFVFFLSLLLPVGCEREPAEEQPSPDPEPPQQHEEMVEEDRTDVGDEIAEDKIVGDEIAGGEIIDEEIIDKESVEIISEEIIDEVLLDEDDSLGLEPGQMVRDARLRLYSEDGSIRWEVSSKEAVRRERAAEISFYPVLVDSFTGENGKFNSEPAYELAGEEGHYLEDDQILTLKGDARLESRELLFLSADISWQLESNLIFSREKTIIKGKDFSAYGQGFEAEADLSRLNLKGSSGERARIVWEGSIHEENTEQ